ncbi:MAG: hypothetical protein DRP90_07745 [Planctomycetota bacterium]|nr:MAG: hypothetical protein DRP90_07745 [Planctomycetota bacterium]
MADEIRNLAERLRTGDEKAFERIVRLFESFVFTQAYSVLGNVEEARDVVQDVFMRLFEKRESIRKPEALIPFLRITARNRALDVLRRKRCSPLPPDLAGPSSEGGGAGDPEADLLRVEESRDLTEAVKAAVADLPPDQREVIRLRYELRLSYAEIAEYLGCNRSVVRGRLYRAHKTLAGRLAPHMKR